MAVEIGGFEPFRPGEVSEMVENSGERESSRFSPAAHLLA